MIGAATLPERRKVTIEAAGLVKRYPLFNRRRDRALAFVFGASPSGQITALDGISFTATAGEALGLIGENGSGKSTLLRLVAGISQPDAGRLDVDGLVAAILELGVGFHSDFTGRENAVYYGALLGLPEEVMRGRLDEVLAFAELGEFIDRPVRTYSTGMSARLAFAVATNVEPRVLVVDEALAVGDGSFQKKCVDRMVTIKQSGRTVVFCSHTMQLVAGFCERAMWLRRGRVEAIGPTQDVINAYEEFLRRSDRADREDREVGVPESGLPRIARIWVDPLEGRVSPGDAIAVHVEIELPGGGPLGHAAIAFQDEMGTVVACFSSLWDGRPALTGGAAHHVTLRLPAAPFARGSLDVLVVLSDESGVQIFDRRLIRAAFRIRPGRWQPGLVEIDHDWVD